MFRSISSTLLEVVLLLRVKVRLDFIIFQYVLLILLTFVILNLDFGFLTLPAKMPEFINRKTDFLQSVDIDLNLIAYK
jgi:hypothetical protein